MATSKVTYKQQLLEAYLKHQNARKWSHHSFCVRHRLREDLFCRWRSHPEIQSPVVERAILKMLSESATEPISSFSNEEDTNPEPPKSPIRLNVLAPAYEPSVSSIRDLSLIQRSFSALRQAGLTDELFADQNGLNRETFSKWRADETFVNELCERVVQKFVTENESRQKKILDPFSVCLRQTRKKDDLEIFVSGWLESTKEFPLREIILLDGDNCLPSATSLLEISPPDARILVLVYVALSRFPSTKDLWCDCPFLKVIPARTNNKNSADIAMSASAIRIGILIGSLISSMSVEMLLVSDDLFTMDLQEEVRDLGVSCCRATGRYQHLGLFLARRLNYADERSVGSCEVVLHAQAIANRLNLLTSCPLKLADLKAEVEMKYPVRLFNPLRDFVWRIGTSFFRTTRLKLVKTYKKF